MPLYQFFHNTRVFSALFSLILIYSPVASAVVTGDLLTGSKKTTPWQSCTEGTETIDPSELGAGGCAYRETPVTPGSTYRVSCGVTVVKYASLTLAFLDGDDNQIATKSTEMTEHVSGTYKVSLLAPAATKKAAIGIYGENGSSFEDCVLIRKDQKPEPTLGSVSGYSWFDENGDSNKNRKEPAIPNTHVRIFLGDRLIEHTKTELDGTYFFGGLDIGECYIVKFKPADPTLQLTAPGGHNDAGSEGVVSDVCLTDTRFNIKNIDAGFVATPPKEEPADYSVCGRTWIDLDENQKYNTTDKAARKVKVLLVNVDTNQERTVKTSKAGRYVFNDLTEGTYQIKFNYRGAYELVNGQSVPEARKSFAMEDGTTPQFTLPADSNSGKIQPAPYDSQTLVIKRKP